MANLNLKELQDKFKQHSTDTGSVELQVVILTDKITKLTQHATENPKDFSTKQGLIKLVSKRKKFLKYVKTHDESKYNSLISSLGLRK